MLCFYWNIHFIVEQRKKSSQFLLVFPFSKYFIAIMMIARSKLFCDFSRAFLSVPPSDTYSAEIYKTKKKRIIIFYGMTKYGVCPLVVSNSQRLLQKNFQQNFWKENYLEIMTSQMYTSPHSLGKMFYRNIRVKLVKFYCDK